jgi:hypothetical protein
MATFILNIILFFSIAQVASMAYSNATEKLSDEDLWYRERQRVIDSVKSWIIANAEYPESFQLAQDASFHFDQVTLGWTDPTSSFGSYKRPIEEILKSNTPEDKQIQHKIKAAYNMVYMSYTINDRNGKGWKMDNYFYTDLNYNVVGIVNRGSYSFPSDLMSLDTKWWLDKFGHATK